jgi:hypothetical protein
MITPKIILKKLLTAVLLMGVLLSPPLVLGEPIQNPADSAAAAGLELKGFVDVAAVANNLSTNGNPYKVNDGDRGSLNLQGLGVILDKLPAEGFGGLLNVMAGRYANIYKAYDYAQNRTPQVDILQAFAQYAHGPFTVQLGKFDTLMGAEVFDSSANPNFSHSINFGEYPYTHTGVRTIYAITEATSLIVGINNGWDQMQDVTSHKTIELSVSTNPIKPLTLVATVYNGVEPVLFPASFQLPPSSYAPPPPGITPGYGINAHSQGNRFMFDTVMTYVWSDTLTLMFNGTVATQDGVLYADGSSHRVRWGGVDGYALFKLDDKNRIALRLETFRDQDGYKTWLLSERGSLGTSYTVNEITLTYGYALTPNLEIRTEVRLDTIDRDNVFIQPDGTSTRLDRGLGLQGVYKF